ncbi:MAG TPA: response regulator [Polyangia bacterium]|jgi:NtrC-family two-component system response regulator AlgB|nr:response regulator [Polyangia bacterium]
MAIPPTDSPLRVLIVDDEKNIRQTLSVFLEKLHCAVDLAGNSEAAIVALTRQPMDLVFLDLRLGTEGGEELIPRLLALSPALPIVVFTAYSTVQTAVDTIKRGAWDYLAKPYTPEQIQQVGDPRPRAARPGDAKLWRRRHPHRAEHLSGLSHQKRLCWLGARW